MTLGASVKWRTVWPAPPITHKMAFIRCLFSSLSVKAADRHHQRPDREQAACSHGSSAPPSPGPTHRHASSGGAAASITRTRRGSSGHERLESAQPSPRKRRPEPGGRRARSQGSGLLPSQRPGVSVFLWVCQRTGSRETLCPVVVVVVEDEHRAEGRALRQHAHTAGARRQRAKDPLWARRITTSAHAQCAGASDTEVVKEEVE